MIITLKGANFSTNNIGTLSTWTISRVLGNGATYSGDTYVDKNAALNATVTIAENYELNGSVTVTMGGSAVTSGITVDGNTITIAIASVTGNVVIKVPTKNTTTGEEGGGDEEPEIPINPPSGDETTSGTLFLQNGALSVVSGENFYVSLNSTTSKESRMNSSSLTEATGIWVDAGATITLTGTSGLRFDYVYATKPGPNSSTDKKSNVIGGVGTCSNFVSSDYFPLNADGNSNTISITNNYGQGYYYHFAIAAPDKTAKLNPADYNITYVITPAEEMPTDYPTSGTLPLQNKMISVVKNEGFFLGSKKTTRISSGSSTDETGIYIPIGKTITLTGISGLRMDYVWANNAGPCSTERGTDWGGIGAASNFVAADYFPLNADGSSDTITITNDKGNYYFFFCFAAPDKTAEVPVANYNITWTIS